MDFAGTDSPITADEYAADAAGDLWIMPFIAGMIVPVYHIEGLGADAPTLIVDRSLLVDIYLGAVNDWSDSKIARLNPGLKSAGVLKGRIRLVLRSGDSGTNSIITDALSQFSRDTPSSSAIFGNTTRDGEWGFLFGTQAAVGWPVYGDECDDNSCITSKVLGTPGAFGLVDLATARDGGLAYARMVNRAGLTVAQEYAITNMSQLMCRN